MKIILIAIVLLSGLQYASADITLTFSDALKNSDNTSVIYSIKDQQLKFVEPGQNKLNIYNAKTEAFVSLQVQSGQSSTLNKQQLNLRVNQLNKERLKTLEEVEKKLRKDLPSMTSAQQEAAETLLNIYKYPELYGEHTSLIVKSMNRTKVVNGISCKVYHLYKLADLKTSFCFADAQSLKISDADYKTLRRFYAFNYAMQSQMLIAMGKTKFTFIDYDQHDMPGVLIESIRYKKPPRQKTEISFHSALKHVSHSSLKEADFTLPTQP